MNLYGMSQCRKLVYTMAATVQHEAAVQHAARFPELDFSP